jgi:hypothetical protein
MVFNNIPECRSLIDDCAENYTEDDQLLVNRLVMEKYFDFHEILSQSLFPNGFVYFEQERKNKAMIIHNNWIVGIENKINRFKNEGVWYVE